ncbi:MAG: 30S ribosomal protein S5 [Microgenomates group bacterium GW2011_GWF2_45_18]|nr:MAG: 30S ribosomal protein S5 [Microgenomates group bacterium GW2011_GWF1_44_10]KKU01983.1 MAG: 30S ribosomal protein S5 [Microgenomates group bacterium GW2011_GWF2_45_18]OGJ41002.1 MAG: 30S ribosomal protein S5 [Candidatus Pacebacteria bacterium RIFOXYB1_FULL_44_10]HAU99031.1 30S ribosomal protein S5 [Candidatus Paceibacterota bacterium]HAX01254.1 30S ribosomal protein S5 [Candidatus Paceibacterota bacterium]
MQDRSQRPEKEFVEKVIQVNRVSKKTKGGNQMSFSVLVVIGDKKGRVGSALGKAKDVSSSVQKAVKRAKRMLIRVPMHGTTIPFALRMKFGASELLIKPAPPGSGIMAGGSVRAVLDSAGIRDVSCKVLGTNNPVTNVYAMMKALKQMSTIVKLKNITLRTVEQQESKEKLELRHSDDKKTESVVVDASAKPVVVEKKEKKVLVAKTVGKTGKAVSKPTVKKAKTAVEKTAQKIEKTALKVEKVKKTEVKE